MEINLQSRKLLLKHWGSSIDFWWEMLLARIYQSKPMHNYFYMTEPCTVWMWERTNDHFRFRIGFFFQIVLCKLQRTVDAMLRNLRRIARVYIRLELSSFRTRKNRENIRRKIRFKEATESWILDSSNRVNGWKHGQIDKWRLEWANPNGKYSLQDFMLWRQRPASHHKVGVNNASIWAV